VSGKYPEVPPEIEPFLKYSRQVATAIVKGQSMAALMSTFFGKEVRKHPEILETLQTLTFDDICVQLRPFVDHPQYGVPVRVVIEGGREWVEKHLKALREEFL
jgi:hypothetical protein